MLAFGKDFKDGRLAARGDGNEERRAR